MTPLHPPSAAELTDALAPLAATSVECALADFTSRARGKQVAAAEVVAAGGCRVPSVLLGMGLTGGAASGLFGPLLPAAYADVHLVPDLSTLVPRPGRPGQVSVLCEPQGSWWAPALGRELQAWELSPRAVLRQVLARLQRHGLQARVAPELELFLLQRTVGADGHVHLAAARPAPGAPVWESACEAYSLERCAQFDPFFDALYAACALQGITLAGHQHEAAFAQYEVNFHPGEPLAQADAVFRFKRLARELAAQHGFVASFAAKPFVDQPGTGMHWHFSLQHHAPADGWPHVFATPQGAATPALSHFLAGLQAHMPAALALLAPYDMSFDRLALSDASPTHADWADEDRHVAFRVPASSAAGRRVENRLPGGDVSPYLAVALTLGLGLAGLQAGVPARSGRDEAQRLPGSLGQALQALQASTAVRDTLGPALVALFVAVKQQESAERNACADPRQHWDLHHLLELA